MDLLILILISLTISIVCAVWCSKKAVEKGFNPGLWGVLGFLFPLIAVIAITLMRPSGRAPGA